jgi:hydroxypyruvate reductase
MAGLKQLARRIFSATLSAIDICRTMERRLGRRGSRIQCGDTAVDLRDYTQIRLVAMGKAAHGMAEGLAQVLWPDFRAEGVVVASTAADRPLPGLQYFVGAHPLPSVDSLAAGCAVLQLLQECNEGTLVFFLLSGGGSSLVEWPLDPEVTLEDLRALHDLLVTCGAPIEEINGVRKHVSAVKGGRLAQAARRAMKLTLAVMDVPEGKEDALASGPTLPDPTTVLDARRVIEKYGLRERLPRRIREMFDSGCIAETPKQGDDAFARAAFSVLLGRRDLLHQAHCAAEAVGFHTQCDDTIDGWPVGKAASFLLGELAEMRQRNPGRRVALVADGEVLSPVTDGGMGGRNAAFVLDCVTRISAQPLAVFSAGTDGIDGNSPAAGAVADGETLARARSAGLDPGDFFGRCDSYSFFAAMGDAVVTGATGKNLRDLRILLAE